MTVSILCSFLAVSANLPLPLKVRTRTEKGDALVHDGLADPEVVVDPLLDAGGLAELIWFYSEACGAADAGEESGD